jgi:flagellar basal-body rod protein FlgB
VAPAKRHRHHPNRAIGLAPDSRHTLAAFSVLAPVVARASAAPAARRSIVFIEGLTNADALPTLERAMQFASKRQTLLAHNLANVSTPMFQPKDVSVSRFQQVLGQAIDQRRARYGGHRGALHLRNTSEVRTSGTRSGELELRPSTASGNILFHDRNDRDLERMMQDLAENVAYFRVASELYRSHMSQLRTAISMRI